MFGRSFVKLCQNARLQHYLQTVRPIVPSRFYCLVKDKDKLLKPHGGKFVYDADKGGFQRNKLTVGKNLTTPLWDATTLVSVDKNFYRPHEKTQGRTDEEVQQFLEENRISASDGAPRPIQAFDELQLDDFVAEQLKKKNFQNVTPVQAQGWPIALSGSNMVGIAQTGSGKTLGYILPAIVHIRNQPCLKRGDGPIALVMAPTRELAQQIQDVAMEFGDQINIRSTCLFGGGSRMSQLKDLERGSELVIATPGRLLDLLECQALNLHRCSYLVLDEADRMLDMGFEPQIRKVLEQVRPDRQTLMWSATWPTDVRNLASEFLAEYIHLTIGSLELAANHNIRQLIRICESHEKMNELRKLLLNIYKNDKESDITSKILIFVRTKKAVEQVQQYIIKCGVRCVSLHGNKTQMQRDFTLKNFRESRANILVATDLASRGLDVDGINYVINYDFPNDCEDYIHRIGRTGRSNNKGTSYTLFTQDDARHAQNLINVMKEANQELDCDLQALADMYARNGLSKDSNNRKYSRDKPKNVLKEELIPSKSKWDQDDERY